MVAVKVGHLADEKADQKADLTAGLSADMSVVRMDGPMADLLADL